jgi:hypothetical protein
MCVLFFGVTLNFIPSSGYCETRLGTCRMFLTSATGTPSTRNAVQRSLISKVVQSTLAIVLEVLQYYVKNPTIIVLLKY